MNSFLKQRLADIENKLTVTEGQRVWGKDKLGGWD